MGKIPETFQFGSGSNMDMDRLLETLQDMYIQLAEALNQKPDVYTSASSDGDATDTFLSNGDININLSTDKVEMVTNHTSSTNITWTQLS